MESEGGYQEDSDEGNLCKEIIKSNNESKRKKLSTENSLLHKQICYLCNEKIDGFKISSPQLSNDNGTCFCIKCLLILEKKYKQLNNEADDDDYENTFLNIEYRISLRLPTSDIKILSDIVSNRICDLNEKLIEEELSEDKGRVHKKARVHKTLQKVATVEKNRTSKLKKPKPQRTRASQKNSEKQPKARKVAQSDDITCRVCIVSFSNKDERLLHERKVHRDSKTKLCQCPNCDFSSKLTYLVRHCKKQVCINRQKKKTLDKAVNCRLCKLIFATHELRSQHEIDVHLNKATKLYYCNECNFSNIDSNNVMQHMLRIHEKGGFTTCRICNQRGFATQQLRNIHEVDEHMDHSTSTYPCLECSTDFVDKHEFIYHLREHNGATISIRPICGKNFGSEYNMTAHMDIHKMTKEFQCDICGKTYKTKNRIKVHLKTHSSYKKYQCDQCDKSYKGYSDLRRHKYTHGLIEPRIICNVCEKKFFEPKFFRAHMKVHGM